MSVTDSQFSSSGTTTPTASERVGFIVLMLLGIGLRLYHLDSQSLWADEGIQYFISSADTIQELLERRQERTFHNALSFIINHFFLQIRDSDFFLRLPSALFGIATLPLAYLLAHKLLSRTAALCTLFIFAISPLHIWYSQEARMYAPLLFVALLSTLCLCKAVERGHALWWLLYIASTVLGLYLHIFMVINVMVHSLWLLFCHRRAFLVVVACGLISALLALPVTLQWGQMFLRKISSDKVTQAAIQASEDRLKERVKIGWQGIPYTFFVYGAGFSLGPSVTELHEQRNVGYLIRFWPSIVAVGFIGGGLLAAGLWILFKYGSGSSFWLCSFGLFGTIAGVVALTAITRFTFNVRYAIIAYPYFVFFLSTAIAFGLQKRAWVGAVAMLFVAVLSTISLTQYFNNPGYAKEDIRAAVRHWQAAPRPSHLLSYSPAGGTQDVINRYLTPSEQAQYTRLPKRDIVDHMQHFFQTHGRESAYLLLVRDWHQKRENAVRQAFSLLDEQVFPGVRLIKISPK